MEQPLIWGIALIVYGVCDPLLDSIFRDPR